jgi:hypothetical protein
LLCHAGKVDRKFYMDNLQLESAEYDLISAPQRGVCLFKSGADRNLLYVHAPPHKHVLITGGDGCTWWAMAAGQTAQPC